MRVRALDARGLSRTSAFGGRSRAARIRRPGTVRATTLGELEIPPRVIAACFADGEGFCGVPRMAERNGRLLIATQEGADLRFVESTDQGRTFRSMTGVR